MKKKSRILYFLSFAILTVSCQEKDFTDPPIVSECDFSDTKTYTMTDIGLELPHIEATNVAFHNAFNIGGVIYNLNTLLETKGDYRYPENDAAVYGKFTADGTYCKGEKEFEYKEGDPNVMMNSVSVPIPASTNFRGEVTIKSKTDSFREQGSGYNHGFYVRWEVTENDPDNFIDGNLKGEKIGFDWDQDMM